MEGPSCQIALSEVPYLGVLVEVTPFSKEEVDLVLSCLAEEHLFPVLGPYLGQLLVIRVVLYPCLEVVLSSCQVVAPCLEVVPYLVAAPYLAEVPCLDAGPFQEVAPYLALVAVPFLTQIVIPFLALEVVPCLVEDPCLEAVQSSCLQVAVLLASSCQEAALLQKSEDLWPFFALTRLMAVVLLALAEGPSFTEGLRMAEDQLADLVKISFMIVQLLLRNPIYSWIKTPNYLSMAALQSSVALKDFVLTVVALAIWGDLEASVLNQQ